MNGERRRRPILQTFVGNNRQMLQNVRDSLINSLQKKQTEDGSDTSSNPDKSSKMARGTHEKALEEIRNSLKPHEIQTANSDGINGELDNTQVTKQMVQMPPQSWSYDEDLSSRALRKNDPVLRQNPLDYRNLNGHIKPPTQGYGSHGTKVNRKPSFERRFRQDSPVSDNTSIRSDSPRHGLLLDPPRIGSGNNIVALAVNKFTNGTSDYQSPPPLPPRVPKNAPSPSIPIRGQTPPPSLHLSHPGGEPMPTPVDQMSQMMRRMSPVSRDRQPIYNSTLLHQQPSSLQQPHGTAGHPQPPIILNGHSHAMQSPYLYSNNHNSAATHHNPNAPGQMNSKMEVRYQKPMYGQAPARPHYIAVASSGANPDQPGHIHPQSGYIDAHHVSEAQLTTFSGSNSSNNSSPASSDSGLASKTPVPKAVRSWGAKQAPIIMQSVKSQAVPKPVLQTATGPLPPVSPAQSNTSNYITSLHTQISQKQQATASSIPNKLRNLQIQITKHAPQPGNHLSPEQVAQYSSQSNNSPTIQINIQNHPGHPYAQNGIQSVQLHNPSMECYSRSDTPGSTPRSGSPLSRATNQSPVSFQSTPSSMSTTSTSDIPDKPPPPYSSIRNFYEVQPPAIPLRIPKGLPANYNQDYILKNTPPSPEIMELTADDTDTETNSESSDQNKQRCTSPIPERKPEARKKDDLRSETKVRNYSPQAFKFYMEQHVENVLKCYHQRQTRSSQLETEMAKVGLSNEAQNQVRRMLHQKESNYIRLKRAKMNKHMFKTLKVLGIGAFGEVALVTKTDVPQLYAMKTLRKSDVLRRNQVAHVKAERDILAEADNEWVVKLYYTFQDRDNLYFVMDYIQGGDMMGLLIKFGIFDENLARFYIAELVLAIESVHKMGFIHRDIKPDNILIDKEGHIKLTDFGLCTGFRWTHDSKYYQKDGIHERQNSMDVNCSRIPDNHIDQSKPLERRRNHQRSMAHSLVGTPNYIAPEVLLRSGYLKSCDWWSVGVILYEMIVGQPPFYATTPAETQYKVIHHETTLKIPREANLSAPAIDLIQRLCCSQQVRLGNDGAREIKLHPFFASIPFEGLRRQEAPYRPKIRHQMDTSNFDPIDPDKLKGSDSDSDDYSRLDMHPENGKHPEHAFIEFTFRRFFDDGGHPYPSPKPKPDTESDHPVYV